MTAALQPSLFDQPAPYRRGSDTSQAAARRIRWTVAEARAQVLALYVTTGAEMTADECAARLRMPGVNEVEKKLSIRPRVTELVKKYHLLEDTGKRRENDSGATARVLRAVKKIPSLAPRHGSNGERSGGQAGG